jgi:hypothetical protein
MMMMMMMLIIIIIMYKKGLVCFLFLDPQNEVGPSISSSVVLCSFVLLVYILMLVFGILFVSTDMNKSAYLIFLK